MVNDTLTAVPGVTVGHWTDLDAATGVTVIDLPEPNVAAVDVRGGAPGTRETALLAPGKKVEMIQAITLAGGSAFGLAAADGVVASLEAADRGHVTMAGKVPIVPAAIIFDLMIGDGSRRPDPDAGSAAFAARSSSPVPMGSIGAGTGAVVAGWRGREAIRKGGLGSAALEVDGAVVGALAVVNAVGDVFTLEGEPLTGGPHVPALNPARPTMPLEQTVLICIATNAALQRTELMHLAVRAHDALGACLRPAHTRHDGDIAFVVSCGDAGGDPDALGEAAFAAVGLSVERAVTLADSLGGVPSIRAVP
ncbi:MAG: P1 family peptidase [Acidimicrobiia bacterium]|nr:P1 family peptidase [Acidimicrobiia bacterium]